MKNKNLVIKFKGEFELRKDEDIYYFIDEDNEQNYLDEFPMPGRVGDLKSFDGVRGLSAWAFDAFIFTADGEAIKYFYGYSRG